MIKIMYEDDSILVVEKPAGMESQSSRGFAADMVSELKKYLSTNESTKRTGFVEKPENRWAVPMWELSTDWTSPCPA